MCTLKITRCNICTFTLPTCTGNLQCAICKSHRAPSMMILQAANPMTTVQTYKLCGATLAPSHDQLARESCNVQFANSAVHQAWFSCSPSGRSVWGVTLHAPRRAMTLVVPLGHGLPSLTHCDCSNCAHSMQLCRPLQTLAAPCHWEALHTAGSCASA